MTTRDISRTALLLGMAILFQGIRLVVPIPPVWSMFLVGSLVNMCFLVATSAVGVQAGILLALATPIVAHVQGMLPFWPFIFPVALGNTVFVYVFHKLTMKFSVRLVISVISKMVVLYGGFIVMFQIIPIFPDKVQMLILFSMSWPQLVTGIIGGLLYVPVMKRMMQ